MYMSPAEVQSFFLSFNQTDCPYVHTNESYFDPRCRPWFNKVKLNDYHDEALIIDPYVFANDELGQTACIGN